MMFPYKITNITDHHRCIVNISCEKNISSNESLYYHGKKADIDITCLPVNMSNTEFKCFWFFSIS